LVELDAAGTDYFHFDIMDVTFVPNFAMSPDMMKALRPATKKPFDAHLMMVHPERHLRGFVDAGADSITVHAEAAGGDLRTLLESIRRSGRRAGAALNPSTPVSVLHR
jgi:ribulose-phosphate 3-epimerase